MEETSGEGSVFANDALGVLYLGKGDLPEVARYGCRGLDTVIKPACRVGWVLLT